MAVCGSQGAGRRREGDDGVIESEKIGKNQREYQARLHHCLPGSCGPQNRLWRDRKIGLSIRSPGNNGQIRGRSGTCIPVRKADLQR